MPVMQMRAMALTAVSTIPDRSLVSPGHGCDTASAGRAFQKASRLLDGYPTIAGLLLLRDIR